MPLVPDEKISVPPSFLM
jgi:hypothetical protein